MNKLFIHHPLFRLFSPIFSGAIVYLLILLINNNVEQIQEQFLGQELYVCIGLSFIIQEFSRLLLLAFNTLGSRLSPFVRLLIQTLASMALCIVLVTLVLSIYYDKVLGYSPSSYELWVFNSIFCCITLIYVLLHISHEYLYKVNTKKLNNEYLRKQLVEDDFMQFKKGINPNLLFECFEAIIVLLRQEPDKVDDLIDNMAMVYRYILSSKNCQLIAIDEELKTLDQLTQLFNYLPFRNATMTNKVSSDFLVVPGSLLVLVETIIRTTIKNPERPLNIDIGETDDHIDLIYVKSDTIFPGFETSAFNDINERYGIYSDESIVVTDKDEKRIIRVPKLLTKTQI